MKIFVVNGYPGSGKTTFENYVEDFAKKEGYYTLILSTVTFVKKIATEIGWDGTKTPKNRKFLSDLKNLLAEWGDIPFLDVKSSIRCWKAEMESYNINTDKLIVFIDCREPKEIERLCKELGAESIFIVNYLASSGEFSNDADAKVANYTYDYKINNNGFLADLLVTAADFVKDVVMRKEDEDE